MIESHIPTENAEIRIKERFWKELCRTTAKTELVYCDT
jgi:hypothetical protein